MHAHVSQCQALAIRSKQLEILAIFKFWSKPKLSEKEYSQNLLNWVGRAHLEAYYIIRKHCARPWDLQGPIMIRSVGDETMLTVELKVLKHC